MGRVYSRTEYHIVFSTSRRVAAIHDGIQTALYDVLAKVVRSRGGRVHAIGGVEEHVHLDVEIPVSQSVSEMVRAIKSISSGWMRTEGGTPRFRWQRGYSVFTVSPSQRRKLCAYIDCQSERHQAMSPIEELKALHRKHDLESPTR